MRPIALLACVLPIFLGCNSEPSSAPAAGASSGSGTGGTPAAASSAAATDADPVQTMRAFIAEFDAKPEHTDPRVKVRHLLVSFRGAGTSATRSKEEAEQLSAELWARIQAGEDFAALVRENSDDSPEGVYTMVLSGSAPGAYPRGQMVPAFGNTGWRLQVGEFGIAGYDPQKSPYGWHLVQRLEE